MARSIMTTTVVLRPKIVLALLLGYIFAVLLPALQEPTMTHLAPLRMQKAINWAQRIANRTVLQRSLVPSTATTPIYQTTTTPQIQQSFSTSTTAKMDMSFKDAIVNRRTIYQLTPKSPIPDTKIQQIVEAAVKHVPSSFNSQSARIVLLLKDEHKKFWGIVKDILKTIVPEDSWEHTAQRISGFENGYGTILFYEEPAAVKKLQETYPLYADKFPQWSEHTSAMHQYMLWTALETEGFGANLQHYNPLPDQKVSEVWKLPAEWSLKAQLVFGQPAEGARESLPEKAQQPLDERMKVFGAS